MCALMGVAWRFTLTLEQRSVLCDALTEFAESLAFQPSELRRLETAEMMLEELRVEVS